MTHSTRLALYATPAERIAAVDLTSHAETINCCYFIDEQHRPVYWVRPGNRQDGRTIDAYFRHWRRTDLSIGEARKLREKKCNESPVHRKAKNVCLEVLPEQIRLRKELNWELSDPRSSYYPLKGNMLRGVNQVKAEHPVWTCFGEFRLDIVLLRFIKGFDQPLIMGAFEFELTHRLTPWKAAACQLMGFPIITVCLQGMNERQITVEWLLHTLQETSTARRTGRRRTFIFLPRTLYPSHLDLLAVRKHKTKHKLLIFAGYKDILESKRGLLSLREKLNLGEDSVSLRLKRDRKKRAQKEWDYENSLEECSGNVFRHHWYLQIILSVPTKEKDSNYLFHVLLVQWLARHMGTRCHIGYKPMAEIWDSDAKNPFWFRYVCVNGQEVETKIAPKLLSFSLIPLKKHLNVIEAETAPVFEVLPPLKHQA
jgi:hypothetical protein